MKHIHSDYSPNDLYNKIIDGLNELGKDLSRVTLDDLQPVDEFHIRGDVATRELIKLAEFAPDMHILDVGCGIGGSTRRLSHETGCRVTGIDLSDEYIDVAERLTKLLNMHEQRRSTVGRNKRRALRRMKTNLVEHNRAQLTPVLRHIKTN